MGLCYLADAPRGGGSLPKGGNHLTRCLEEAAAWGRLQKLHKQRCCWETGRSGRFWKE